MPPRRRRLLWQLYLPFIVVVTAALIALSLVSSRSQRDVYLESRAEDLAATAELTRRLLEGRFRADASAEVDAVVDALGPQIDTRITVVLRDGQVIGDSDHDPATMDNHASRPEIEAALAGRVGTAVRYSDTQRRNLMYVAVPVGDAGEADAVVRTAVSLAAIDDALAAATARVTAGGIVIALLAAAGAWFVSRRVTRPLEELKRAAALYAAGELDVHLPASHTEEVARLADAMRGMAEELDRRIRALVEQRNEQQAVLSSMVEGVIAIDGDGRVIALNEAGGRLLQVAPAAALGQAVEEVARNPELQGLIADVAATDEPLERDIVLHALSARTLQAHAAPVRDGRGERIGGVVVLHDVSRVRRLETVRSDFVANVSHELRTPITSIKGFLETLADGAIDDPDNARRFVDIALRQADRLNAIIEDLLALSRLEQESGQRELPMEAESVRPVLDSAMQVCSSKAAAKSVVLKLDCSDDLTARMSPALVEQALVNLIDNAIKFSDAGDEVVVSATAAGESVVLGVRDHGSGIEPVHVPRLFERFYRVDKARSRELGGTGLGLAIVKHIASVHGGSVDVESEPGRGSTFRVTLCAST